MALARVGIAVFAIGVAGIAAVFALNEYRAFLQWSLPIPDLLGEVEPQAFEWVPARSIRTEDKQMLVCIRAQQSFYFLLEAPEKQAAFAVSCASRADEILARSPTRSVAHLARSNSQWNTGNPDLALSALDLSAKTAPNEGWLAAERLRMAFVIVNAPTSSDDMVAQALDAVENDVRVLVRAPSMVNYLARLFNANEAQSDWFIAIVETQPDDVQRRFIGKVRASAAGAGS